MNLLSKEINTSWIKQNNQIEAVDRDMMKDSNPAMPISKERETFSSRFWWQKSVNKILILRS